MTEENTFTDSDASRRRFLTITAGTVLGASALAAGQETTTDGQGTTTADGDQPEPVESFRFGGEVEAWQGQEPEEIADTSNPTVELQAGHVYEITWENLDGQPHNWAFRDGDGNDLAVIFPDVETGTAGDGTTTETETTTAVGTTTAEMTTVEPPEDAIEQTDQVSEEGATQTLRFVATSEMVDYYCPVHPNSMVGEVTIQGDDGTTTTE